MKHKNKQQYMLKLKSAFNRATAEIWCQRMFLSFEIKKLKDI
mgnify:CR=1 FL=1